MINSFLEMFSYSFMIHAFIVGILISLSASLIGVSLVLRKNSMIGDGLSHVGFGAFAVATIFGFAPLEFAIPVVVITSFFILKLNENNKIHGDSAIALLSASSLAIGTFLISITPGVNTDVSNYLFGSILAINKTDVIVSVILTLFVICLYIISYNKIFAITFDEKFAKSIGINTNFYNIIFSILCSLTVVLGMRLLGSLLISSLIIFPALISMNICKNFKNVVILSAFTSIICFILGITISFSISTPTGATVVLVNLALLIITIIVNKILLLKNKSKLSKL